MITGAQLLRDDRTRRIDYTIDLWIKTKTAASNSIRTKETYEQTIIAFRSMALATGIDLDGFPPIASAPSLTFEETEHALAALGLIAQALQRCSQKLIYATLST